MKKTVLQLLIGSSFFWSGSFVNAQSYFQQPPFDLAIHNPSSVQGQRRRTTISIPVPKKAGVALKTVVLTQLPSPDQWYWGRQSSNVYLGSYALRGRKNDGKATASVQVQLFLPFCFYARGLNIRSIENIKRFTLQTKTIKTNGSGVWNS